MTNDELKDALVNKSPLIYNNIEYAYLYGITYTCPNGKIKVSAVLMDKNGMSLVTANPLQVKRIGEARDTEKAGA